MEIVREPQAEPSKQDMNEALDSLAGQREGGNEFR